MTLAEVFRLDGRTAIITGASRGIGRSTAQVFGRAGANVVLAARGAQQLEVVQAEIEAEGGRALAVPADVGNDEDVQRLVDRSKEVFGGVDVLVNNAAARAWDTAAPTHELKPEIYAFTVGMNIRSPFLLCQLAIRQMLDQGRGGAIVNVTSIAGWMGIQNLGVYSASKAALMRWSETMALEVGPYGIRVNCVGPGFTQTDETRETWEDPVALEHLKQATPLRRPGQPEDMAHAVLFMASDAASFITGQTLYVDGGWAPVRPAMGYRLS